VRGGGTETRGAAADDHRFAGELHVTMVAGGAATRGRT
jgi:hypothetical protein